jgi:hypothetical protein
MSLEKGFLYPMFKMILGVMCIILSCEYAYSYCVFNAATFGILYIGDTLTWFLSGFILFTEGLQGYLQALVDQRKEEVPLAVDHRS